MLIPASLTPTETLCAREPLQIGRYTVTLQVVVIRATVYELAVGGSVVVIAGCHEEDGELGTVGSRLQSGCGAVVEPAVEDDEVASATLQPMAELFAAQLVAPGRISQVRLWLWHEVAAAHA